MSNLSLFGSPRVRHAGEKGWCCVGFMLATAVGSLIATHAPAGPACKPVLNVKDATFSAMLPPTLERRWTATVVVDASACATTAGYFELGVRREKESSLYLEFREQLIWSAPSTLIGIDFAADEAMGSYWIDSVQACPCAKR